MGNEKAMVVIGISHNLENLILSYLALEARLVVKDCKLCSIECVRETLSACNNYFTDGELELRSESKSPDQKFSP